MPSSLLKYIGIGVLTGCGFLLSRYVLSRYKIRKWLRHLLSGKSEIQRLCESDSASTLSVEVCIENSTKFSDNFKSRLRGHTLDVDECCSEIITTKRLPQSCRVFVMTTLNNVWLYNRLVDLIARERESYDTDNEHHEALLMKLWSTLKPQVPLVKRRCEQWKEIGFQGLDPATDFRSMGVLGLKNLVYFASYYNREAQAILEDSHKPNWFSFSITGLNITCDVVMLLEDRVLRSFFYERGCNEEAFNELYCVMFTQFNELWTQENPRNVMSFQRIHEKFLRNVVEQAKNGFLTTQTMRYNPTAAR